VIGEAMAEAERRAGDRLACRPGCTECCHGPFPVNGLDAERLRSGLATLRGTHPERAAAVVRRSRAQSPILSVDFPGDPTTGRLAEDDTTADPYYSQHGGLPCPALDPDSGRCDLYAHRPLACRTFGPPVRFGDSELPPCHLCFVGASAGTIDSCRVEPDPHGVEDRMVRRFGAEGETLVAFVLADG
jgi:Fe-S-cluster containining protein